MGNVHSSAASHSMALKSLFVGVNHPLALLRLHSYLFLRRLAHYLTPSAFSQATPEVLLIPNKGRALELALGGKD